MSPSEQLPSSGRAVLLLLHYYFRWMAVLPGEPGWAGTSFGTEPLGINRTVFWATVKNNGSSPNVIRSLSCPVLSVTLVCCDQTVGWITMPLVSEVDLSPGHIVFDGPSPSRKGAQQPSPTFAVYGRRHVSLRPYKPRPMSIVAKWLDGSGCHLLGR